MRKAVPSVCTSRASSPCIALIIRTGLSVTTSSPCIPAIPSTVLATVPVLDLVYIRVRCWSARFERDDAVYDLNEISYSAPAEGERSPDFNMEAESLDRLHLAIIYDYAVYQQLSIPRSKKCQKSCKILREKFGS